MVWVGVSAIITQVIKLEMQKIEGRLNHNLNVLFDDNKTTFTLLLEACTIEFIHMMYLDRLVYVTILSSFSIYFQSDSILTFFIVPYEMHDVMIMEAQP